MEKFNLHKWLQEQRDLKFKRPIKPPIKDPKRREFDKLTPFNKEPEYNVIIPNENEGCTDPDAINYNPNALLDDGLCRFFTCTFCQTYYWGGGQGILPASGNYWLPEDWNGNLQVVPSFWNDNNWTGGSPGHMNGCGAWSEVADYNSQGYLTNVSEEYNEFCMQYGVDSNGTPVSEL